VAPPIEQQYPNGVLLLYWRRIHSAESKPGKAKHPVDALPGPGSAADHSCVARRASSGRRSGDSGWRLHSESTHIGCFSHFGCHPKSNRDRGTSTAGDAAEASACGRVAGWRIHFVSALMGCLVHSRQGTQYNPNTLSRKQRRASRKTHRSQFFDIVHGNFTKHSPCAVETGGRIRYNYDI